MRQERAVQRISESLQKDELVQAVYLKGSMGRGEEDEHSDVDLYVLVKEEDEEEFLKRRVNHLGAYRNLLFYDDIFIIAPQIIAVFDDMLHVDLFTVTQKSFKEKDYFRVVYDPDNLLEKYESTQNLLLSPEEFYELAIDVPWFLFQYRKAFNRGNDLWGVEVLQHCMFKMAKVLLHRYYPGRAQLGMKALGGLLPADKLEEVNTIYKYLNPENHQKAGALIIDLYSRELSWIEKSLPDDKAVPFFRKMAERL
ncbi:nucleotidyltransferase domain-containing protein [Rossellomorea vietnamensis]|uniref:Nucleotidyltransferase domain-containing protein n=1 Tax=Rossellomorea vietnamensis TaxID=218284 RepID=A0A5D4MEA4_9BACI|nr:nucleotidyltransferase domain-containing protein [Rossellomorea vietnamensis]TYR99808.1 nucleotidyltransferase domain-containing protein [Rossellomorea vietnamensis]